MAATLEVNYFSTFWLKKIKSITDIETVTVAANASTTNIINLQVASNKVGAGQVVTNLTTAFTGTVTVVSVAAFPNLIIGTHPSRSCTRVRLSVP